jgi:hypothetical protein
MNRLLALLVLVPALAACPPVRGDDDDDATCDPGTDHGTVQACVFWSEDDPSPVPGGTLRARPDSSTDPIEVLIGDTGCAEVDLEPGDWELSASNEYGDCVTAYEVFEVVGCDTLELDFYVMLWCMDG